MTGETTWSDYYRENEGREPRALLLEVLGSSERPAGQLLGDRDTWAPDEDISSFSDAEARVLFEGWTLERFEEEENDGSSCDGPKHWHVFHVVASAPSS